MGKDLTPWQGVQVPKPTPELTKSLGPRELEEHRSRICFEVRTVLSAYFQPSEPDDVKMAQLAWWADELEDWKHESIVWALRKWNREKPRMRPTPGDIVAILKKLWGHEQVKRGGTKPEAQPEQSNVERISPDRANEILREMGMTRARLSAVQGKEEEQ